ncbi:hypothetical protein [Thioalkalivibrio sp. HK1]|uniref:hypothetical protein n=1 Tax=Thioalkalivibrio sp. HK1 TaxID=1469245 RepID=UPI00046F971C|nr:hypothetical protein [Thioalkalivibrio sp. HK1]
MKKRHHRLGGLVAAMALGILVVFTSPLQAQSGADDALTPQPADIGGWIEHDSQLAEGGWIEHDNQLASPHGSGGLKCDHQGNCRQASGGERTTMFAGLSIDPPQPLCDTDPYSCFYLVDKDQTLPAGLRNTQQAFLE